MTRSTPREPPSTPDATESQWHSIEKREVLEYISETDTYRASFDSATESVQTAVVLTVAAVSQTRPMELPPLFSVIDPDAVEALVESAVADPSNVDIHVSFVFNDCNVTVHSYGIIAVQPPRQDQND